MAKRDHIENLGGQYELTRLNTYIPKELHKQLLHRERSQQHRPAVERRRQNLPGDSADTEA